MANKLTAVTLLLGCAILAGCESRTNVSATGNTPAQFTHVFLTINQIWFNTSATAVATDSTWSKFTLTTPQTIDLVNLNNGALSAFASQLKLSAGTYSQVMLVLADSTAALSASASSSGAASNDEVDYLDSLDVTHTVPLAILNAAQGISISTSLTVASATTSSGFGAPTVSTVSTSSTDTEIGSSSPTPTATSSSPVVSTTSAIIDFDDTRDLVPISLSGQPAFALNPHPQAYNVKYSGNIQGAVDLSAVATLSPAGLPDVQVAAEALSSDGTRHVILKSTRVDSDGNFILYPLSTASGAPGAYDLVIHGPSIDTVIIKSVPVTAGAPGTGTALLGTLTLTTAAPFLVNLSSTAPAAPVSSVIGFYQTLPLPSEVPYLVEWRAPDPISGVFASDQSLSGGSVQYGTYLAGGTIALTTANPSQGAATYGIAAINPAYGTGALGSTVSAPAGATTALFTLSAPAVPTGSTADGIAGTVSIVSAGAYDNAELFLTYNGALIASAPLNAYLSGAQTTLNLPALAPGGGASARYAAGVYNAEIWAWNSSNPTGTLTRSPVATPIDLSAGNATGVALNIP
jgi:hypothetical protein